MTAMGDAIGLIRDVLKMADDLKRAGETLKELSHELREHDRRITRLEAKWDAAMMFAGRGAGMPRQIEDKS
jgi:hypothetical protein